MHTPILLIIFNRPDTTQKVFESIKAAQPHCLYVAADAPRPGNIQDKEKCAQTRAIVQQVDWDCQVQYLFQENNLGCSLGPRTAFDWFFAQEEEGIILEDDCVPHPDFFRFAAEMLEKYRFDQRIISINGCNLGYNLSNGYSYTFSRFMNMWGWATWRDRAQRIDYELNSWKSKNLKNLYLWSKLRRNFMDIDIGWLKFWRFQFDKTIRYESDLTWWDYQWIYYQLENQLYSVVPAKNLVVNIGFNSEGHHTLFSDHPAAALVSEELKPPFKTFHFKNDAFYEENFVKRIWCGYTPKPLSFHAKMTLKNFLIKLIRKFTHAQN